MNPERQIDVQFAREFYERQREDSDRILLLLEASEKLHHANEALKRELAECKKEIERLKAIPMPAAPAPEPAR